MESLQVKTIINNLSLDKLKELQVQLNKKLSEKTVYLIIFIQYENVDGWRDIGSIDTFNIAEKYIYKSEEYILNDIINKYPKYIKEYIEDNGFVSWLLETEKGVCETIPGFDELKDKIDISDIDDYIKNNSYEDLYNLFKPYYLDDLNRFRTFLLSLDTTTDGVFEKFKVLQFKFVNDLNELYIANYNRYYY